jgi:hypothetical protein
LGICATSTAGRQDGACAGAQVNEAIDYLSSQLRAGGLQGVQCVPASDQSASEAAFRGVPLTSLETRPKVRRTPWLHSAVSRNFCIDTAARGGGDQVSLLVHPFGWQFG